MPRRLAQNFKALLRSGAVLTPAEQGALLVVLALFLLGVAVRCWHGSHRRPPAAIPGVEELYADH